MILSQLILSSLNSLCRAFTAALASEFFTTNARLSSDEPWVIIDTLTLFFSIAPKTFEATPTYIFNPLVPKRIFDLLPKVKLIAILRNPTNRAISHYFMQKRKGNEKLPILEALKAEEKRLAPIIEEKDFSCKGFRHFSYKNRGIYIEQIERYLNFFPRDQLLIINSENLLTKRAETLKNIFDFIGIDSKTNIVNSIDLEPDNVAYYKSKVSPEVYEYLNSFFRPYNKALFKLLGENFGW